MAINDAIALVLEEPLRNRGEQNHFSDAGRAREPLQILYDDPPESAAAPAGGDCHRAQQSTRPEALQRAGAENLCTLTGNNELRF